MLIGAEARCYGEQKRIVVIQIIDHRKETEKFICDPFGNRVQFGTYPGMGRVIA